MSDGFDLFKLMKEAGRIQEMVNTRQAELERQRFSGEAGAGMVAAEVNGLMEVLSIKTDPKALESLGLDSVLELATAALNTALKKAREAAKGDMMAQLQNMAGSLLGNSE